MRTAFLSVLVAFAAPVAAQNDSITWTDGSVTKGVTVTGFTIRQASYKTRGSTEQKSSDMVLKMDISKVKDKYRRAFTAGRDDRVAQFLMIAESLKEQPFLSQFGYMEAAQMLLDNEQYGDAFGVLEEMTTACPDSGFVPILYRAKCEYYLGRQQKSDLAKVAGAFAAAAQTQAYPQGYVIEAEYYRALARALNGELTPDALRKEMQGILRRADPNFPVIAGRARLSIADNLRIEGKIAEAKNEYQDLIDDDKTAPTLLPAAWLGLGHTFAAEGTPNTRELYRSALLAYLRVYLDDASSDALKAESLYFGAQAAQNWGGEGAARHRSILRGRLLNHYPDSSWAKK